MSEKQPKTVHGQYDVFRNRMDDLYSLDEQKIVAIMTLHIESGLTIEKLADAFCLPLPILNLMLAPRAEGEE